MSKQEIDREIVIIQKSFDYILGNLLSTENVEVPFPDQQKYQLKKILQECKDLTYKGFYRKAYEQLFFTVGYLFTHFEIVREKVQNNCESMLRIIDVKTARIREIENLIEDGEKGIRPRREELDNIKSEIDENLEKLEYVEDIFNFSRERLDEFSDFVGTLDKKRLEPDRVRKVLLKELNSMQNLILAKYESKLEKRKEKHHNAITHVKEAVKKKVEVEEKQNNDVDEDADKDNGVEESDDKDEGEKEEKGGWDYMRRTKNG